LKPSEISPQFLLGVLAAGYTGTDFIEAFLKKSLPNVQKAANVSAARTTLREDNAINARKPGTSEAV
jgi:hypothetical protein